MWMFSLWGLAAAVLFAGVTPTWAQDSDPVKLKASYTVQTDSNLFRLPASASTMALIGKSSAAEKIETATVGLHFNTTQSLQRFELDADLVDYKYQNFSYLNFTANNYNAAWRWALTPRMAGNFTSALHETLNSFSDYQGYRVRNQRSEANTRLDTIYKLDGPWRLLGGVAQSKQVNQQALVAGGDFSSTSADFGIRHAFASGNAITYTTKIANGSYLNRVLPSVGLFDDSFKQIDNDLRLHWAPGGNSTADIHLTHVQRTHPNYDQRNFSGFNTDVHVNWAITGKSVLGARYTHELGTHATANSNYSQTDRITLGPVWNISPTTQVRMHHTWAQIDYLGSPTAMASKQRRDITRDTALTFSWQPYQLLMINASLQRQTRGSNQASLDYDSNIATLAAHLSY